MPLLDPTADERALAAKILGQAPEDAPVTPDPEAGDEDAAAQPEGKAPAEKDVPAAALADADVDDAPDEPVWYKKRISTLTRKLKAQEEARTARDQMQANEVRAMREELAALKQQREAPAALGEDATPQEIQAHYDQRLERERQAMAAERERMRLDMQVESLRDKYDGNDGKPTYDELYERYAPVIDQLPAYVTIKAKIQQAPNMPREFTRQALKLWEAEQKEVDDGKEELDRERDAGRTPKTRTSARSSSSQTSPTEYERQMTAKIFGDRLKPEDIAAERVRMARESR